MKEIEKLIEEKPTGMVGEGKYTFLKPTKAVHQNATFVPVEQRVYQQKYQEFVLEKHMKKVADMKYQELQKPEFERY